MFVSRLVSSVCFWAQWLEGFPAFLFLLSRSAEPCTSEWNGLSFFCDNSVCSGARRAITSRALGAEKETGILRKEVRATESQSPGIEVYPIRVSVLVPNSYSKETIISRCQNAQSGKYWGLGSTREWIWILAGLLSLLSHWPSTATAGVEVGCSGS